MYAFASAGAHRNIIIKMGKRLASQFPNLVIIFGPRRPKTKGQGPQEEEEEEEEEGGARRQRDRGAGNRIWTHRLSTTLIVMAAGTRRNPFGARPDFATPLLRNSRYCWSAEFGTRRNPLGTRPDFSTPLGRNSHSCWFNEVRNPAEPAPEPAYFEGRLGRNVHFRAAPDHQYILLIKDTGTRAASRT